MIKALVKDLEEPNNWHFSDRKYILLNNSQWGAGTEQWPCPHLGGNSTFEVHLLQKPQSVPSDGNAKTHHGEQQLQNIPVFVSAGEAFLNPAVLRTHWLGTALNLRTSGYCLQEQKRSDNVYGISNKCTQKCKISTDSVVVWFLWGTGQAEHTPPAALQVWISCCSAIDPSLRKELSNTIQRLLLRDRIKTGISKSCAGLSCQGGINNWARETCSL